MSLLSGYIWFPAPDAPLPRSEGAADGRTMAALCALTATALALPPVHQRLGIDPWIACPLILSYGVRAWLVQARLLPWIAADARRARAKIIVDLLHGVLVADGLAVATHDPATSLWVLAVIHGALDGADYDLPPLGSFLTAHVAGPLATIPVFLAMGNEAASAIGIPAFVAVMIFIAFHYGAIRKVAVSAGFAERDRLHHQLLVERAAGERERVQRRLSSSIAERLRPARESDAQLVRAARECLGELRAVLDDLAPRALASRSPRRVSAGERSATYLRRPRADADDRWNWSRANALQAAALSALSAAVLTVPAVAGALGVRREIVVPLVCTFVLWLLVFARILPWVERTARRRAASISTSIALGNIVACGLAAASADPDTPLWTAPVLYAAFNGSDHEFHASYPVLAVHVLGPLVTIPIFLALGAPAVGAVAVPMFVSAACFASFHHGAVRSRIIRRARAEEASLRVALEDERHGRERERIARDLHDGVASSLSLVAVYADLARTSDDEATRARLHAALGAATEQGLGELEALLEGLAPAADRLGALASLLEARIEPLARAASVPVEVRAGGDPEASVGIAARYALLRIAQEAFANALRHGRPTCVTVELSALAHGIELRVTDDGCGFETGRRVIGRGLSNMRRRAEELGGELRVASRPGATAVRVCIPAADVATPGVHSSAS